MPELDNAPQSSWADEIEEGDISTLPAPFEKISGNEKTITQYAFNEDGKKVKIVRTYKIEKKLVSKAVARRKALPKFGLSKNDRPGPNPATTVVAEEIFMQVQYSMQSFSKQFEKVEPFTNLYFTLVCGQQGRKRERRR
jgi:translation initiation factor 3 subunit G